MPLPHPKKPSPVVEIECGALYRIRIVIINEWEAEITNSAEVDLHAGGVTTDGGPAPSHTHMYTPSHTRDTHRVSEGGDAPPSPPP